MNDEDFAGIMAGLDDAVAYAKGDKSRGVAHPPIDAKAVRVATKKSQRAFAATYRIPIGTLRDWEQGRRVPDAPARNLLRLIEREPKLIEKLLTNA